MENPDKPNSSRVEKDPVVAWTMEQFLKALRPKIEELDRSCALAQKLAQACLLARPGVAGHLLAVPFSCFPRTKGRAEPTVSVTQAESIPPAGCMHAESHPPADWPEFTAAAPLRRPAKATAVVSTWRRNSGARKSERREGRPRASRRSMKTPNMRSTH